MHKSASGPLSQSFSHSPSRSVIRWKSRSRDGDAPFGKKTESLATISSQLKKTTEVFESVNKTKELLIASTAAIRRKISRVISECQMLKKNHEKLHNESLKVSKKTERLFAERVLIEKESEELKEELEATETAAEKSRKEIGKLRARIAEENAAVASFSDACAKLRKEADKKMKERDAFKSDTALIAKQIEDMVAAKSRVPAKVQR